MNYLQSFCHASIFIMNAANDLITFFKNALGWFQPFLADHIYVVMTQICLIASLLLSVIASLYYLCLGAEKELGILALV